MTTAERLRKEGFLQGEAQGVAQGAAQGRAEMLLRQLTRRFGPVPADVEARVRSATIPDLDHWADAVLTAASLDAVLA